MWAQVIKLTVLKYLKCFKVKPVVYFDRKVNYDGSNDCMHVNLCGLVEQRLQPDCVKAYVCVYKSNLYCD